MKKILYLFVLPMTLIMCASACEEEFDLEYPSKTFCYTGEKRTELEIISDSAFISFRPENEGTLRSVLSELGMTLTDIKDGYDLSGSYNLTYEAAAILSNRRTATVIGDYRKAKSTLSLTMGWSPYYKVTNEDDIIPGRVIAFKIYVTAKLAKGVDLSQLMEFAKKNNLIYGGEHLTSERWHILIVTNDSQGNTIQTANLLRESGLCEYVEPEYVGPIGVLD